MTTNSIDERHTTIGARLRRLISLKGLTFREFAGETGIPYGTLQNYLSDKRKPGAEHLQKVADIGIDVNWILMGKSTGRYLGSPLIWPEENPDIDLLTADITLTATMWNKAQEIADDFHARYIHSGNERLGSKDLFRVVVIYYRFLLLTASSMLDEIFALRKAKVSLDNLVDTFARSITSDQDSDVLKKLQESARAQGYK